MSVGLWGFSLSRVKKREKITIKRKEREGNRKRGKKGDGKREKWEKRE